MQQWQLPKGGAGVATMTLHKDISIPTPSGSQMVVKMKAVSLNHRDLYIAETNFMPGTLDNVIPLSDGSGEVTAVGPACTRFQVGDRVALTFSLKYLEGDQMEGAGLNECRGGTCQGVAVEYVLTDDMKEPGV
ncbi:alcohol dehydrogenase [Leptomonas pyrrhocoris]|uniref:Alcohol dehydrogenase n=1 Tax=Leptomonas pyrrhocoris TaxID=157538 RepID=A0A0M9FUJ4_LEPPY|nr:alcohol dehydrogenase [Leptomonas pyrrhocoris]KPA76375.1 alcohol dehydrogenase [Leptomonas pyrrhocoris]|eukprot:XP_015654814.1 alcohol dehydrogenase [Leptomonas pyrrhocoris]